MSGLIVIKMLIGVICLCGSAWWGAKHVDMKRLLKRGSEVDVKDCYFDPECHAKVDWERISTIKKGFFGRLKMMKDKGDTTAVKNMMAKVHSMFLDAGMPDDRIDYILDKWVKAVLPVALQSRKHKAKKQFAESSVCQKCIAAGKDFCISGNTCIPRATFNCKGPEDHITGDRWFAAHGNPDGIQHSMVCPEVESQKKDEEGIDQDDKNGQQDLQREEEDEDDEKEVFEKDEGEGGRDDEEDDEKEDEEHEDDREDDENEDDDDADEDEDRNDEKEEGGEKKEDDEDDEKVEYDKSDRQFVHV